MQWKSKAFQVMRLPAAHLSMCLTTAPHQSSLPSLRKVCVWRAIWGKWLMCSLWKPPMQLWRFNMKLQTITTQLHRNMATSLFSQAQMNCKAQTTLTKLLSPQVLKFHLMQMAQTFPQVLQTLAPSAKILPMCKLMCFQNLARKAFYQTLPMQPPSLWTTLTLKSSKSQIMKPTRLNLRQWRSLMHLAGRKIISKSKPKTKLKLLTPKQTHIKMFMPWQLHLIMTNIQRDMKAFTIFLSQRKMAKI